MVSELFTIERENNPEISIEDVESNQVEIRWTMRAVLLDWMSEVCYDFDLGRETLYYSLKYLDLCLITMHNLQKSQF